MGVSLLSYVNKPVPWGRLLEGLMDSELTAALCQPPGNDGQ